MKSINTNILVAIAMTTLATPFALAAGASCKYGSNTRTVEVAPIDASQPGSCAVSYLKETETPGATQILWQAKNESQYCVDKAKAFVEKLQGMGWACDGDLAGAPASDTKSTEK